MYLKHYHPFAKRVPDPMRPGRTAVVTERRDSGATELTYVDESGKTVRVQPDEAGWFDVPDHATAERLRKFRHGGGGWFAPDEVDEDVSLGRITEPPRRPTGRKSAS